MGSSQEPGTDWVTMFASLTPQARSFSFAPLTRGSMMVEFQRAWTMPMRRPVPSCCWGVGPLREDMIGVRRVSYGGFEEVVLEGVCKLCEEGKLLGASNKCLPLWCFWCGGMVRGQLPGRTGVALVIELRYANGGAVGHVTSIRGFADTVQGRSRCGRKGLGRLGPEYHQATRCSNTFTSST